MTDTTREMVIEETNKVQIENARGEAENKQIYPLGRVISIDNRDQDFPLHFGITRMKPQPMSAEDSASQSRYWNTGDVLNQQNTNHCVGYSFRSFLDAAPIRTRGGFDGDEIYYKATELDHIPGVKTEDGTSIRAGVKALEEFGHIKQYLWAYDVETIANYLFTQGTLVIGTNWYEAMNEPLANDGFLLRPRGRLVGGHAYHIVGVDRRQRIFKIKNSWSQMWGNAGFAYVTYTDLQALLAQNGEAVAPLEEPVILGAVR